jgi:hypothetical protein
MRARTVNESFVITNEFDKLDETFPQLGKRTSRFTWGSAGDEIGEFTVTYTPIDGYVFSSRMDLFPRLEKIKKIYEFEQGGDPYRIMRLGHITIDQIIHHIKKYVVGYGDKSIAEALFMYKKARRSALWNSFVLKIFGSYNQLKYWGNDLEAEFHRGKSVNFNTNIAVNRSGENISFDPSKIKMKNALNHFKKIINS